MDDAARRTLWYTVRVQSAYAYVLCTTRPQTYQAEPFHCEIDAWLALAEKGDRTMSVYSFLTRRRLSARSGLCSIARIVRAALVLCALRSKVALELSEPKRQP